MTRKSPRLSKRKHEATAEIEEAAYFFRFGYLLAKQQNFGTGKSRRQLLDFWTRHRREILAANSRQCEALKKPFVRPRPFMDEIEREHPRRQVGVETWWGPWTASGAPTEPETDAVYEDDATYLHRLGLLAGWELEVLNDFK